MFYSYEYVYSVSFLFAIVGRDVHLVGLISVRGYRHDFALGCESPGNPSSRFRSRQVN